MPAASTDGLLKPGCVLVSSSPLSMAKEPVNAKPECRATRYAIKFDPPCFCLEYQDALLKKRVRQVKLTKVAPDVDPDRLTRKIIRSFPRQLDVKAVKYEQVRKLVFKLLERVRLQQPGPAILPLAQTLGLAPLDFPTTPKLVHSDSPKIANVATNSVRQSSMVVCSEDRFSTSSLGDTDSSAERGVDEAPQPPVRGKAAVDEEEDELDMESALSALDRELGDAHSFVSLSSDVPYRNVSSTVSNPGATTSGLSVAQTSDGASRSRFAQEADRLVLEVSIEGDVDLNKVTDVELKMVKIKMEEIFAENRILPGDPMFEYDKQVEFGPATEANEWDDSGDDEGSEGPELQLATQQPEAHPRSTAASDIEQSTVQPRSNVFIPPALDLGGTKDDDEDEDGYSYGDQLSDEISPVSIPDELSPTRMRFDADDNDESLEWPC